MSVSKLTTNFHPRLRYLRSSFAGSAFKACLKGIFLILFHEDFVEIRDVINGTLRQIISGRGITCLDTGSQSQISRSGEDLRLLDSKDSRPATVAQNSSSKFQGINSRSTVKIAMQHPENEQFQMVLELVENPELQGG